MQTGLLRRFTPRNDVIAPVIAFCSCGVCFCKLLRRNRTVTPKNDKIHHFAVFYTAPHTAVAFCSCGYFACFRFCSRSRSKAQLSYGGLLRFQLAFQQGSLGNTAFYFSVALSSRSHALDFLKRTALECSDFPHDFSRDYSPAFLRIIIP